MIQLDDIKNFLTKNSEKIIAYSALIIVLIISVLFIYKGVEVAQRDNETSAKIAENLKKRGFGALRITAPRPSFLTTDDNGNLSKFDPSGKEKLNNDFRIEGEMEADGIKINGNLTSESVTSKGKLDVTGDITSNGKLNVTGNITSTGVTETKQLNIKTTNPAGGTYLNFSDGKNYLTGDTIIRGGDITSTGKLSVSGNTDFQGGTITIKTNNPAGGTHFNWPDGKNYLTGDTIFRGGNVIVQNNGICINGTCINETDLQFLKKIQTGVNIKSVDSGSNNLCLQQYNWKDGTPSQQPCVSGGGYQRWQLF